MKMSESIVLESNPAEWMDGSTITSRHLAGNVQVSPKIPRSSRSKLSSSIASAEVSLEDVSDRDEFAFMASVRAQRLQDFIYSNDDCSKESRERLDRLSEFGTNLGKEQTLLNKAAWEVIDREITEWQRVCSTGRPSWWSPVAKGSRMHQNNDSHTEDSSPQTEETKSRLVPFEEPHAQLRRARALSDTSLPSTTQLHDLAHLIAIQLLSACFTLPPEHISQSAPSSYHYYSARAEDLPDPKLISALRMHTHFRYTPGFGHDARNNSVANLWPNVNYARCNPHVLAASMHSKPLDLQKTEPRPRKPKRSVRRVLNTSEVSMIDEEHFLSSHDGPVDANEIPQSAAATAWKRRKSANPANSQDMILPTQEQKRINISLASSPPNSKSPGPSNKSIYTHREHSRRGSRSSVGSKTERDQNSEGQRGTKSLDAGRTSKALESRLRSEPHPVFVQPVKDLVVKRWRTFRSHFGQGSAVPNPNSTSNDFVEEFENDSGYPSHYVGNLNLQPPHRLLSPVSNDGKERRRRARKASEFNSESSDTPRDNTPMSELEETVEVSDELFAAMGIGRSSPDLHAVEPLATPASEASLSYLTPPNMAPQNTQETARRKSATPPANLPLSSPQPRSQSVSAYSPTRGSTTLSRHRNKRRSMLNEMHTPDTYHSIEMGPMSIRPPLSIAGSALPSRCPTPAKEKLPFDDATPGPRANGESPFDESPGSIYVDWSAGNVEELAVQNLMADKLAMEEAELLEKAAKLETERQAAVARERDAMLARERQIELKLSAEALRPRTVRSNTSGTQRFTPGDDGVEVDGLPVGPGIDEAGWNVEHKGRKGKARDSSFL